MPCLPAPLAPAAAPAEAVPPVAAPEVSATPAPEHRWYGYQILAADAVSAGLWAAGSQVKSGSAGATALEAGMVASFLAPAPIIHLARGRPWRAAGSVSLRIGLPSIGSAIGSALSPKCNSGGLGGGLCNIPTNQ